MVTKGNVLVVDDEINLCRILGAKLAKSGYSVVAVHDGLQAVEKVRESDFDVVLMDLTLPNMDGLTALAQIRDMRSSLPVIVMTACENAEEMAQAGTYGVSAYVNKPFDLDNLVSLVSDTSTPNDASTRRAPNSTVLFCADQPVTLDIQCGSQTKICGGWIHDKNDRTLSVTVPHRDDEIGHIIPRSLVKVGLSAIDAHYTFNTHVLRVQEGSERVLVLDKPGVIFRSQRRQFNRLALRVPAAYGVCDTPSLTDAETINISLGGLCIAVPEEVAIGTIMSVELRPKTVSDVIRATARVVRSCKNDKPSGYEYILACEFKSVDESLHELLDY